MSGPNDSWNQGLCGQPLAPGGDFNQWQQGDSVRRMNEERLAEQNRVFMPQADAFNPAMPAAGPMTFGGGGSLGGTLTRARLGAFLLLLFVGVPLYQYSIPLWVALYPAAAFVAGAAALATFNSSGGPGLGSSGQLMLGGFIGFLVAWPAMLGDQALARFKPYRMVRHAVRLALIFGWAVYALTLRDGQMLRIAPRQRRFPTLFVWSPQHIGLALVAVVVMHFWLSGMPAVRSAWQRLRGHPSAPAGETTAAG
jgi:hypothetical protein